MVHYRNNRGLEIAGRAGDPFVGDVVEVLDFVSDTETGRLLLREIDRQAFGVMFEQLRTGVIRIVPATSIPQIGAQELDTSEATARGAPCLENRQPTTGEGLGSGSELRYTPGLLSSGETGDIHNRESTLVHELTHALRMKMGICSKTPVGDDFDDAEEFVGVMVENYFRAELGWPLRANHHGYRELPAPQAPEPLGSPAYLHLIRAHADLIRRFRWQMGSFAESLEALDVAAVPYQPLAHLRELEADGFNPMLVYPRPGRGAEASGPDAVQGRGRAPHSLGREVRTPARRR
jgi:hypothetical protein